MRHRLPALAALFAAAAGCASCGGSTDASVIPAAVSGPLAVLISHAPCPPSPRVLPGGSSTLVAGHPTGALICRYWSPLEPRHRTHLLAGALQIARADVTRHLAVELNALPRMPTDPPPSCPAAFGRFDLLLFRYQGRREASVLVEASGCKEVTNGQTTRFGLGLPVKNNAHWPDEGLL